MNTSESKDQDKASNPATSPKDANSGSWLDKVDPNKLFAWLGSLVNKKKSEQDAIKTAPKSAHSGSSIKKDVRTASGVKKTAFEGKAGTKRDSRIYDPFRWVKPVLMWTNIQIVLLLLGVIFVWFFVWLVAQRDYMVIDVPPTLPERVKESFDLEQPNMLPTLSRFVYSSLTLMNTFSFEQAPNTVWLQGVVNPDIYNKVKQRYSENSQEVRERGMLQTLTITKIEDVFVSFNRKQLTANIKGYLTQTTLPGVSDEPETQTIPYRARVVILVQPESKLSEEPFYLLQIAEAAGQEDVQRFDKAIAEQKERRGL